MCWQGLKKGMELWPAAIDSEKVGRIHIGHAFGLVGTYDYCSTLLPGLWLWVGLHRPFCVSEQRLP